MSDTKKRTEIEDEEVEAKRDAQKPWRDPRRRERGVEPDKKGVARPGAQL